MLVVLDTTALIDALRGRPVVDRIRALQRSSDTPATTAVNVEELVRGLRDSEAVSADLLIGGLVVLPVDEACGRVAGQWRNQYSQRGVTLHQADCLVAATASVHGARLCTGTPRDFPMLDVEHWPVGG